MILSLFCRPVLFVIGALGFVVLLHNDRGIDFVLEPLGESGNHKWRTDKLHKRMDLKDLFSLPSGSIIEQLELFERLTGFQV